MVDAKGGRRIGPLLAMLIGACGDNVTPPPELPVLYEGNVWGANLAVADGEVYFTTFDHGSEQDHAVWRVPAAGGEPRLLWHGERHSQFGYAMAVDAEEVFFDLFDADDERMEVRSVPIGGGARHDWGLATGGGGLVVDAGWVYAGGPEGLTRAPRAAAGQAQLLAPGYIDDVERRGAEIYITRNDLLERIDAESAAVTPISGIAGIGRMALTATDAFAIAGDAVWRIPLPPAAAPPTAILADHGAPYEIAADGDDLYAVVEPESGGPRLLHVRVSTGAVDDITPLPIRPGKLVISPEAVFLAYCCGEAGSVGGGQVVRVDR